ncbi:MAG: NAD(P)/FAD-dependent oxidoreductase [Ruminococcaceae bacterium]|nr:NAD(P)/FAD-dependent oxidoreductase [Oscillospiraceae bacterium]
MKVLVIGAGAAGLLAAGFAAQNGHSVTLVERNARPARKVMITGKGRCNVTNACAVEECVANTPRNGRFLYSALSSFPPEAMMALVESYGVPLKIERGNRVFPISDKAVDVVDALNAFADKGKPLRIQGRVTGLLLDEGVCFGVRLEDGREPKADAVIICTGGASYPQTGSTGDGYRLAQQAGHTVVPPRPSLVPLVCREADCAAMQGLSLKNTALTVEDTARGKTLYRDFGEMLFTHFGVSGPMILSASAHMTDMQEGRYRLHIDLKPALSAEQLDARVVRELTAEQNRALGNMLPTLLPRSMVVPACERAGLDPACKCHTVSREERRRLVTALKDWTITVSGFRPISEAIITSGGVAVKEIDAKTMASKLVKGLYFAGEVLDVDAYTGGFNLQIAFATGAAAGRGIERMQEI